MTAVFELKFHVINTAWSGAVANTVCLQNDARTRVCEFNLDIMVVNVG